jgi:hypothetical protein
LKNKLFDQLTLKPVHNNSRKINKAVLCLVFKVIQF